MKQAVSTDENVITALLTRGVENVIPRELAESKLRSGERLRLYLGIDPTGSKLHLGHSVPLRKLKQFADAGHHVVFLVGSFTAMIGDPTGRDAARETLTAEQVRQNFETYKRQAEKILDFSKVELRYNNEWLASLTLADLISLASNFTVQQMLQRDMFERRMKEGKPISLHEFLYPVMVGYDSVVLDVDVEVGGSDQEFNMLAGRALQAALGKREKFVLTTPLIEGTDGRKMSKTYQNCIYLEDDPHDMYGKVMSMKDELVRKYFEVLTDVSFDEIDEIMEQHPRDAKMRLAREIVTLYHGADAAREAEEAFVSTFQKGALPDDIPDITRSEGSYEAGLVAAGIVASKSELTRLLRDGGVRDAVTGEKYEKLPPELSAAVVLKIGKRRFVRLVP